jgi:chromosome segregation ATPase
MKLSRRIRDLLRANLTPSGRGISRPGKTRSPARTEARLEQIRKSLAQAAAREKGLDEALALAEQEGQEREANRLRRELAELHRSRDELRTALDLIEARIEMASASPAGAGEAPPAGEALASPPSSLAEEPEEEVDLAARKARLGGPAKPRQAQRD